jgi:hypothetical protein
MESKLETCHHCGEQKENCYHGYIAMCIPIPEAEANKEKWNLVDAYSTYIKECTENYTAHNAQVNEAEIPPHWKPSVMLDTGELLTQEQFNSKVKSDNTFARKWNTKTWWKNLERTDLTEAEMKELDGLCTYDQLLNTVGRGIQCDECGRKEAELYEKYYPRES